jgi:hypothetical protein
MPRVEDVYTSSYVTGAELQPLGQRRQAVIHDATIEVIGRESPTQKIVLSLVSAQGQPWPRKMVLNKTNAMTLAASFGSEIGAWPGKAIEVWSEIVNFRGQTTTGIRLAPAPTRAPSTALAPTTPAAPGGNGADLDDSIPF